MKDKDEEISNTNSSIQPEYMPLVDDSDVDQFDYKDPKNDRTNVSRTKKIVLTAILCYTYMLATIAIGILSPFFTLVVSR